jgi:hypothetical protein
MKQSNGRRAEERVLQALRGLPQRVPPAGLSTSLRVQASRERQRLLNRRTLLGTWPQAFAAWQVRARLFANNLMRPLALPFAGGVFSAAVLFSLLVSSYPVRGNSAFDVPTALSTNPLVSRTAPFGNASEDVVVDVIVDGQGRMIDYAIVGGPEGLKKDLLRRSIENTLLFTEFLPATSFGQAVSGKVRLVLHSSQVDVKG